MPHILSRHYGPLYIVPEGIISVLIQLLNNDSIDKANCSHKVGADRMMKHAGRTILGLLDRLGYNISILYKTRHKHLPGSCMGFFPCSLVNFRHAY